jgi:hypothetical protein
MNHSDSYPFRFRQIGQYHGAGVLTGFELLFRHMAQR